MLIPLGSDAPLYHRPHGTWALMALCVIISFAVWYEGIPESVAENVFVLQHGSINPLQWLGSIFLHGNFLHLAGNLLFLAIFGLIVEGKLGPLRYLALVAGIAGLQGFIEQLIFFFGESGSIGISSVITGLMVISLYWAPRNQVDMVFVWIVATINFQVTILALCCWYIGWDLLGLVLLMFSGDFLSSELLHLLGALAAIPFAIWSLNSKWVDCEGWDLLTIRRRKQAGLAVDPTSLNKSHREETRAFKAPEMPGQEPKEKANAWMDQIGKNHIQAGE